MKTKKKDEGDVLTKAFEESIEELEKAFKTGDEENEEEAPASPEEEDQEEEDEEERSAPAPKAAKTAKAARAKSEGTAAEATKSGAANAEGAGSEGGEAGAAKSIYDEVAAQSSDLLDVSGLLRTVTKSISDKFDEFHTVLDERMSKLEGQTAVVGKALRSTMTLTKAMADEPQPRKSVLTKSERRFVGEDGRETTMTRKEILAKSQAALRAGKMNFQEFAIVEDRLNKGVPIEEDALRLLKSVQ